MKNTFSKSFLVRKLLPRIGKIASVPGTERYVGVKRKTPVKLHILDYNELDFTEKDITTVEESLPFKESPTVTWLNISGVHDEKIINELEDKFKIHPLVLEDITNTTQRPKIEEYDDYLYVILKMAYFNEERAEIELEQVSMIVGKDYVITLQEKEGDILEGLRERIRNSKSRVRRLGSDYLMYGIMDAIVDHYFTVLEKTGEQFEELELKLLENPNQQLLAKIYSLKHELVFLHKSIWPMREVVSSVQKAEPELVSENTSVYLRDVHDHIIQVAETVEAFREMASGMLELYLTLVSNKMNEVMKVLTIFAAIFIPLTFLAGIYGMNFKFMPELNWKPAYFIWWGITIALAVGMIMYFKRKKWL
jgi:magnesium transporter